VTTDNTNMTSEIDSDQAQLDAVQEAPGSQASTTDSTTEEIRALKQLIVSQVAGLQSKVDRGLNGIRRDSEETVRRQQEYALQQYLEQVPEEHRAAFQQMAQQNMELQQKVNQAQNETPVQEQAQSPNASSEWEQIYAIPKSMGLDPQSEGIDYAAFTDPGLNDTQRRERFFTSIKTVMTGNNQTQAPPPATPQNQSQPEVQNPPTGGTPAGGVSGNMRSVADLERAYISDGISFDDYKKRLAELGQR
jgi:hypothetical protein